MPKPDGRRIPHHRGGQTLGRPAPVNLSLDEARDTARAQRGSMLLLQRLTTEHGTERADTFITIAGVAYPTDKGKR
jgi:hypothetical protein